MAFFWEYQVKSACHILKPQQKYPELLNCASCYQNIAKPVTHFSIKLQIIQEITLF